MNTKPDFAAASVAIADDFYYAVHKGIRLANARLLIRFGRADAGDIQEVQAVLADLRDHLAMGLSHLTHENREIHSALDQRCPGASAHAGEDHDHHERSFGELEALADEVARAPMPFRAEALRRLYQRFALFVADDLEHMHEEETVLMPLLVKHFSADERHGIEMRIVTSIPFEKNVLFMRAMLPAASRSERRAMLEGMAAAMPAEAFGALMEAVLGHPWRNGDLAAFDRLVA
ncbi:hypothetical protein [Silicimonas sp. MF1-12-2]|uniref:hypothetical protein n=1 Tax=Silicimonas sp. MF1-12-2 TaxID=3384793 RepID=UPI0039B4485B